MRQRAHGAWLVPLLLLLAANAAAADPLVDVLRRGWTESDLDDVPELIKKDVEAVLRDPSLVRHFARYRVRSDLLTENWLADHPPIAAAVGRELDVLPFEVTESWPGIYALAGPRVSRGTLHVLLRDESRAMVYVSARVHSPWGSTVRANAVGSVRWWLAADGRTVEHEIFIYGRLRSRTARVLNFLTRPLSGPWITRRLRTYIDGARRTAEAVTADPEGWAERMNELPDRGTADHLAWEQLVARREAG